MSITIASFFTGSLVRVYSWVIMLGQGGVVNSALYALGFQPFRFIGTDAAIIIGLVHFSLPLAILVLVGPIKNVDPTVEEAAWTLGADPITAFIRVTLPLCMPGVFAVFVILYAWNATAFIVPMILGAGAHLFIANIIYTKFIDATNFPMGSAVSLVFIFISLLFFGLAGVLTKKLGQAYG
jgi:ABC-type spermidine/putrescine transport system permease subunit I